MKFAIISAVIAGVTLIVEIGFIFADNGFGAGLSLVFGLIASGIFSFLAEMKGGE
jgi:hypothetical protein